ncbi:MAG TPA: FAD-binding oxidoreductase [Casimicrobiaceae bacterium]|nr:FAD-binding oxidoreductase [Casimicrobiaceae bacterium]
MTTSAPDAPNAADAHAGYAARREALAAEVREARGRGAPLALAKETSNLFRDRNAAPARKLDVRAFDHVLSVDADKGVVEAEGMTTYEALVAAALGEGMLPAVVPQLKTITLGGAAAGVGIEASSFHVGLVHDTLHEIDVLTGRGDVLTCRPDNEHSDLFHGFPNSYGTLGYALRLSAQAIRAQPYVELAHRRFESLDDMLTALFAACKGGADFVDGVAFSPGEYYLNLCRFVAHAPYVSDYTYERIYYRSIREREVDYLTAADFIWRWDTDWFWCSKNLGAQNPLLRRLYGRDRLGSRTYQKIMRWNSRHQVTGWLDRLRGLHPESIIQDVDIPFERAAEFMAWFEREIGIAPVWLCPIGSAPAAGRFPLYPLDPGRLYVNFGFWDVKRTRDAHPAGHFNRLIEREVARLGGIKSLYSDSYYSRAEFDAAYGGAAYRALKAKYDPDGALPELYDKCVLRH